MLNHLHRDLAEVLDKTKSLWEMIRGQSIFLTGGTGFIGCWLLETLLHANDQLRLDLQVVALTRNPRAFEEKAPHLAKHPVVTLLRGDVTSFGFPSRSHSIVIHGAADTRTGQRAEDDREVWKTIVDGTGRVLELASHCGATRFLLISSGAVYGPQPVGVARLEETYTGAPDPLCTSDAYGHGKRAAEALASIYAHSGRFQLKVARCFALIGPYLDFERTFAATNFIKDALSGGHIRIRDGRPLRSYLYAADLAVWLWTILFSGSPNVAYNVGSENALTVYELAEAVRTVINPTITIERSRVPGTNPSPDYVPSTRRAAALGLSESCDVYEAIRRTVAWYRSASAARELIGAEKESSKP